MDNSELKDENNQNNEIETTVPSTSGEEPESSEVSKNISQPEEINHDEEATKDSTSIEGTETTDNAPEPEIKQPRNKDDFNGEEEVIYTYEEEKVGNPIVPILLIVGLIVLVFLLPLLSEQIEFDVFKPEVTYPDQSTSTKEKEFYYFSSSSTRAKIGNLELTNFVKSQSGYEYRLSFTLNNVGEKSYDYSKKYYIVLYEKDKVIYRALIHSYDGLGALSATTMTLNISKRSYYNSYKFKLAEIPTSTYPEVKTTNVDGEYDVLNCSYNYSKIKYYFINGELHKVHDEYTEKKANNTRYEEHKTKIEQEASKYKDISNISSVFVETEEDFKMVNDVDLKNVSDITIVKLRSYKFFRFKENIKTVSFEMEAQGYTCG